jgi:hypothetical protein
MRNLKAKVAVLVAILGLILIYIFQVGLGPTPIDPLGLNQSLSSTGEDKKEVSLKPEVVSSNPQFKEDPIVILPNQTIEITFNIPFENTGEVKNRLDPQAELKVELSEDRKTVKFTPVKPLKLGTTYTLSILPDSKFNTNPGKNETKVVLDHNFDFHFKTLEYRGI